jgi:hypothetical protein
MFNGVNITKEQQQTLDNALKLNAKKILSITENEANDLFGNTDKDFIRFVFNQLALKWHPDHNKETELEGVGSVFKHVKFLFENAIKSLDNDLRWKNNTLYVKTTSGKELVVFYIKKEDFELGTMLLTEDSIVYLVQKQFEDLFHNAVNIIKDFRYPNTDMKTKIQSCLPQTVSIHVTKDFNVLTVKKDPKLIRLSDLLDFSSISGQLDPYHVAWILSRLHNMTCYLQWAKLSHQAITLESCFIEPQEHSFSLLGGWWYARPVGNKIIGLPGNLTNFLPDVINTGIANDSSDLNLIRRVCLQLLGNRNGVGYYRYSNVPPTMLEWLRNANNKPAFSQYTEWKDGIRPSLFKEKKGLIPMKIEAKQIYPNLTLCRHFSTIASCKIQKNPSYFSHSLWAHGNTISEYIPQIIRCIRK